AGQLPQGPHGATVAEADGKAGERCAFPAARNAGDVGYLGCDQTGPAVPVCAGEPARHSILRYSALRVDATASFFALAYPAHAAEWLLSPGPALLQPFH